MRLLTRFQGNQGNERLSTFDDIRHRELEEPLAVVSDKFLEQLPRDAVLELTEPRPAGQLEATFIKSKHVLERVELIEGLVAYGGNLREHHLTQRFQSISQKVRELYVGEPLVSRNVNV